jgi:hypothetical protein
LASAFDDARRCRRSFTAASSALARNGPFEESPVRRARSATELAFIEGVESVMLRDANEKLLHGGGRRAGGREELRVVHGDGKLALQAKSGLFVAPSPRALGSSGPRTASPSRL